MCTLRIGKYSNENKLTNLDGNHTHCNHVNRNWYTGLSTQILIFDLRFSTILRHVSDMGGGGLK